MPAKMYNPQNDLRMLVQISKFYIPKVSFQDFKNVYRILSKLLCQLLGNRIKRLKLINILRQFHSFPVQPLNNQNRNASNKKNNISLYKSSAQIYNKCHPLQRHTRDRRSPPQAKTTSYRE